MGQGRPGLLDELRARAQRTIGENAVALDRLRLGLPLMALNDHLALAKAPKLGSPFRKGDGRIGPVDVRSAVGKAWNAPNTALGLAYGSLGHAAGEIGHAFTPEQVRKPQVVVADNAVQFRDNPFGGESAITIGNASIYSEPKYYSPEGVRHEKQHTYQGEQLGPGYLPSNLAGGLNALFHGESWHGDHNWNERGPLDTPPRPWSPPARR
jgi:hypothetical protein